jgi:hypothetical protein
MRQGQQGAFTAVVTLQTPNPTELETRAPLQDHEHKSMSLDYRFTLDLKFTFILKAASCSLSSVLNVLQTGLFYPVVWTTGLVL